MRNVKVKAIRRKNWN